DRRRVLHLLRPEHLDGDDAAEREGARSYDRPHAAGAQHRLDAIFGVQDVADLDHQEAAYAAACARQAARTRCILPPMPEGPKEAVYEMIWDCKFCGQKKLLGLTHRFCAGCGAPQDPAARYFPPEHENVAVLDHPLRGADVA